MRIVFAVLAAVGLSGCAYGDYAGNDPEALPYSWCADQARDAASVPPPPADAGRKERARQQDAARDYHMSQACQQATERKVEVAFPAKRTP